MLLSGLEILLHGLRGQTGRTGNALVHVQCLVPGLYGSPYGSLN